VVLAGVVTAVSATMFDVPLDVAVAFFAADFFGAEVLAVDLFAAGDLFAAEVFVVESLADEVLAVDFLAVDVLAVDFFAVDFLLADFFAGAFLLGLVPEVVLVSAICCPPCRSTRRQGEPTGRRSRGRECCLGSCPPSPDGNLRPHEELMDGRGARPRRSDARDVLGSFIGMAGMAAMLFIVLASGLVAPWWAVASLTVVWLVFFVLAARWFMRRPWWVAGLPVVMALVWIGAVSAGAAFLDWNA
jgi:hypothetical protein